MSSQENLVVMMRFYQRNCKIKNEKNSDFSCGFRHAKVCRFSSVVGSHSLVSLKSLSNFMILFGVGFVKCSLFRQM